MDIFNFGRLQLILALVLYTCFVINGEHNSYVALKVLHLKTDDDIPFCFSKTWIPLFPHESNHIQRNLTTASFQINELEKEFDGLKNMPNPSRRNGDSHYYIGNFFDDKSLHQVSWIGAKSPTTCNDLQSEIHLDKAWQNIKDPQASKQHQNGIEKGPFTSRLDVREFLLARIKKRPANNEFVKGREMCEDRYGRKYPPPDGFGGKCVLFQHDRTRDNNTKLFMPMEKEDLFRIIADYPMDDEIRSNQSTLKRLLMEGENVDDGCMTFQNPYEMIFHCIYPPNMSHLFKANNSNQYACPKKASLSLKYTQKEQKEHKNGKGGFAIYKYQELSNKDFEFSDKCFVQFNFTPIPEETAWNHSKISVNYTVSMVGSKASGCSPKYRGLNDNYTDVIIQSMGNFCPWDVKNDNMTYSVCFELSTNSIYKGFKKIVESLASSQIFDHCHFQTSSSSLGCYFQVDPLINGTYRVPAQWIERIERDNAISEEGEFVVISAEMKSECYRRLLNTNTSPLPEVELGALRTRYQSYSVHFISYCREGKCDDPTADNVIEHYKKMINLKNTIVCKIGNEIKQSPSLFCSVKLTFGFDKHGQKIREYTYSPLYANTTLFDLSRCLKLENLRNQLENADINSAEVTSCRVHQNEYECCCISSNTECNKEEIIKKYYEIASSDEEERKNRIEKGCQFIANVEESDKEKCDSKPVRYNAEMRCYGVFQFPSDSERDDKTIKPKLIKENCYWPHPQYHDKYSIFCSREMFDVDDLVEEGCISLFINDFTGSQKIGDRTLILCCNTGLYPKNRDSILSRSVSVL